MEVDFFLLCYNGVLFRYNGLPNVYIVYYPVIAVYYFVIMAL